MKNVQTTDQRKAKRMADLYNTVPNIVWSVLGFLPLFVFCYTHLPLNLVLAFAGISIAPAFLPNRFFDKIQLANNAITYKKLGVGLALRLSQNGAIINKMIRSQYPHYKALRWDQRSMKGLLGQTYVFEKFHYILFLFFCLVGFTAFSKGLFLWGIALLLINIVYNVYPILLQQFIRTKLATYKKKRVVLST